MQGPSLTFPNIDYSVMGECFVLPAQHIKYYEPSQPENIMTQFMATGTGMCAKPEDKDEPK